MHIAAHYFAVITENLLDLYKFPNAMVWLGGDFNCPGIDWSISLWLLTDSYLAI